jgi:hypothetical protein
MARRLFLLAHRIVALLLALAAAESHAQTASEEELKAAYLLNFALFVQWPSGNRPTFTVCQYGSDSLGAGGEALARRNLRGKPIVTRRVNHRELADCAILYIPAADRPRIRDLAQAVRGMGVLTVSDAPGAAREGAVIGLSMAGQKIVFDVNVGEARRNNLVISAKLLSLAQSVVEVP